jgi:hypothetical protein
MLMSSVVANVRMCEQEEEKKRQERLGKGNENGAVDSEHGANKGRSSQLRTTKHHSIILGLGKMTNSQDKFPAIQEGYFLHL